MAVEIQEGHGNANSGSRTDDTMNRDSSNSALPDLLGKRLALYALAAGAGVWGGMTALPAIAEIVYTPAHTPIIDDHGVIEIDLNQDGITDFTIRENCHCRSFYEANLYVRRQDVGAAILSTNGYAAALVAGTVVGPGDFQGQPGKLLMLSANFYFEIGPWSNAYHRFLGLKFSIGGQVHYGWAELNVNVVPGSDVQIAATLIGYAYETLPNRSLRAGQTHGSYSPTNGDALSEPTLGMLASGSSGLDVWRREEDARH
jgi:hypothetical protein